MENLGYTIDGNRAAELISSNIYNSVSSIVEWDDEQKIKNYITIKHPELIPFLDGMDTLKNRVYEEIYTNLDEISTHLKIEGINLTIEDITKMSTNKIIKYLCLDKK
jgi:hypothetical protein